MARKIVLDDREKNTPCVQAAKRLLQETMNGNCGAVFFAIVNKDLTSMNLYAFDEGCGSALVGEIEMGKVALIDFLQSGREGKF